MRGEERRGEESRAEQRTGQEMAREQMTQEKMRCDVFEVNSVMWGFVMRSRVVFCVMYDLAHLNGFLIIT